MRGIDNIGDVTGDSIDDIVIATQLAPRLLVLNGINGNILFDYVFGTTLSQRGDRAAVLNDIDTNGVNEFLGGNREGRVICFYGGNGTITSISPSSIQPVNFELHQNYPNPFNPSTNIKFDIAKKSFVNVIVYDALGRELEMLVNEELNPGSYSVVFNGSRLSSGIYYYKIVADEFSDVKKMLLVK